VTITAEALDGNMAAEQANTIEIFVESRAAPALSGSSVSTLAHTTGALAGGDVLDYACRVVDEDGELSTSWRAAHVGNPPEVAPGLPAPIPILFGEPQAGALDFVFVADDIDFSGPTDMAFLTDVHNLIRDGYFGKARGTETFYLKRQKQMNFWISPMSGRAEDSADGCDHEMPYKVNWTDAYALVHRRAMRDCAPSGEQLFSIESNINTSPHVLLHETGHRPFGLADEYCCDGGYFQTDELPNLYEEPEDCQADLPNLPGNGPCREFDEEIDWWFDRDWSTSDPDDVTMNCCNDHLMDDNGPPRGADIRRINHIFDSCLAAKC
jgi:hypothetical protein